MRPDPPVALPANAGPPPTQFGEAFVGRGSEAAHVNTVLGARGGPVETAWVTALATPGPGHAPFVAVVRPGLPAKPFTLFVNKAAIAGGAHARLTWGAAQAGVASGVLDAVATSVIPPDAVDSLLLVAAVWVDPEATDEELVFDNNRRAMRGALESGRHGRPLLADVLAARDSPLNPFFRSDPAPHRDR
ncbi:MAG: formaldehyde-activating enzyme [Acidimicrobiales bacterium]